MKIIADSKIPFLKEHLDRLGHAEYLAPGEFTPENVSKADALIVRTRTRCDEHLLKGSAVKAVATATIGTDHIYIEWCEGNGIRVFNAGGCNAPAVADYVFATLLAGGFVPAGKTLGVIGMGNIGSIVASVGCLLGCRVIVSDPPLQQTLTPERIAHLSRAGIEFVRLDALLSQSDAVTLHTPLTRSGDFPTYHLISTAETSLLKPDVFFINAARGGIVDETALLDAVNEKNVRAIVDVWENEPSINQNLLKASLYATPHIAGYSLEGKMRASDMVLSRIAGFFNLPAPRPGVAKTEGSAKINDETLEKLMETGKGKILEDSQKLKSEPELFEHFRENYAYRNEVLRCFSRI